MTIDPPDDGHGADNDDRVVIAAAARRWAAELLDVPIEVDHAAQRAAVLRKLADDDFMIWDQGHVAVTLLAGSDDADLNAADWLTIAEGAGRTLQTAVQDFSQQFFHQSPAERQRRWRELRLQSDSFPALVMHLDRLEPGLDVVPHSAGENDQSSSELIAAVCREFTAWPSEAARVRRATLKRFCEDAGRWSRAADAIARKRPDIAGLTPKFHEQVRQLQWRDRRLRKGRRKREKLQRPQLLTMHQAKRTSQKDGPNWAMFALLGPLFLVLRACVMTLGPETSPPERFDALDHQNQLQRALESMKEQSPAPDGSPLPFKFDGDQPWNPTMGRRPQPWDDPATKPQSPTPKDVWEVPTDSSIMPRITRLQQVAPRPPYSQPPTGLRPSHPGASQTPRTPGSLRLSGEIPGSPSPPAAPGGSPGDELLTTRTA